MGRFHNFGVTGVPPSLYVNIREFFSKYLYSIYIYIEWELVLLMLLSTLLCELKKRNIRYGVISMCIV